ncbi:hypothetical protein ABZ614_26835 [Streptomyces sp. NPDC013178]|uniref:hypothetical protein n=1 Tax=Streptomyces sp. NPDC013178 TaxID=3155118 RepID=UPI0033D47950
MNVTGVNGPEVNDPDVRVLLGRAVDGVPAPTSPGADTVFARAARVRWRRRGLVTAAVVAVGAVGFGAGFLPDGKAVDTAAERSRAASFAELLPSGVGTVREVSLKERRTVLTFGPLPAKPTDRLGPYDGDYTVSRDGGVGILRVRVVDHRPMGGMPMDPCREVHAGTICESETLPNGNVLHIQGFTGKSSWGRDIVATVYSRKGPVLYIEDNDGITGEGSPGPVLDSLPLTKKQLRELASNPELLP